MLDRNDLSIEPFRRNFSFRCFDMSHQHVSYALMAPEADLKVALIDRGCERFRTTLDSNVGANRERAR